jgi:deoxyribodipyrimidine photolyase
MTKKIRLIWHRRDLRLHDNALYRQQDDTIFCSLFIFDPAFTEPRPSTFGEWHTVWMGPHALSALLHALQNLRQSLRERGNDLWIRSGDPVVCIPALARQVQATQVAWHIEPGWYEEHVSRRLQMVLIRMGIECVFYTGCTLYHPDDVPQTAQEWKISQSRKYKKGTSDMQQVTQNSQTNGSSLLLLHVPPIMGNFRTACRKFASVRTSLPTPVTVNTKPLTVWSPVKCRH